MMTEFDHEKVTLTEKAEKHYTRLEKAEEQAKARGLVLVTPRPCEAFVDIDCAADLEAFEWSVSKLSEYCSLAVYKRPSPSGEPNHFHVIVRFRDHDFDAGERIMIQAALGSDRKRELLGIVRLWTDEEPTIFFEKPEVAEEIAAESEGWEDGLAFVTAETEAQIEAACKSTFDVNRDHKIWWITARDGAGCFEGTREECEIEAARLWSPHVQSVKPMPYPREPRMGPKIIEGLPALCSGRAGECAGHTACPMGRACSE